MSYLRKLAAFRVGSRAGRIAQRFTVWFPHQAHMNVRRTGIQDAVSDGQSHIKFRPIDAPVQLRAIKLTGRLKQRKGWCPAHWAVSLDSHSYKVLPSFGG